MSRMSYIARINTVHIERGDQSIFITSKGPNYIWRDNKNKKGQGEGYAGLHAACDALGAFSQEEYDYIVKNKV